MHQLKIFFFNDTATTEIYTLSLHDALPIYTPARESKVERDEETEYQGGVESPEEGVAHPGHPCQRQHHSHTQHHGGGVGVAQNGVDPRSEERRGGKEGRSRWSPYH